uniref:Uncharacterized protein LOC116936905 n=1 Tax=Petromyzon marinus TaxID=7757 RepID=A0AAJ7SIE7_PETMA|nr:uncharacterized protein LOC116936905 [Petromyzon marinus]
MLEGSYKGLKIRPQDHLERNFPEDRRSTHRSADFPSPARLSLASTIAWRLVGDFASGEFVAISSDGLQGHRYTVHQQISLLLRDSAWRARLLGDWLATLLRESSWRSLQTGYRVIDTPCINKFPFSCETQPGEHDCLATGWRLCFGRVRGDLLRRVTGSSIHRASTNFPSPARLSLASTIAWRLVGDFASGEFVAISLDGLQGHRYTVHQQVDTEKWLLEWLEGQSIEYFC